MGIITKNKYFFTNDTNCSKIIFKDIDFYEQATSHLITKKKGIIQRKLLHEEVGNLFIRLWIFHDERFIINLKEGMTYE